MTYLNLNLNLKKLSPLLLVVFRPYGPVKKRFMSRSFITPRHIRHASQKRYSW